MFTTITVLLILFIILGTFDGLYFHLFKYRLHLIPAARREHLIHTARAFVFVPISLLLFVYNSSGLLLWLGIVLVALDGYLELLDILEERKSRASLGGISSEEAAIHVFASSFKFAAILLLLSTKDSSAYMSLHPTLLEQSLPIPLAFTGIAFAIGSFLGGIYSLFPTFKVKVCTRICPEPYTNSNTRGRTCGSF